MEPTTIAINGDRYDVFINDDGEPAVYIPNGRGGYERATDRERFTVHDVLRALSSDDVIIVATKRVQNGA